jgi:hypothetical protein
MRIQGDTGQPAGYVALLATTFANRLRTRGPLRSTTRKWFKIKALRSSHQLVA